jgi:hydroxymethylbilane synthase
VVTEQTLRVASRGSQLALWQANAVAAALRTAHSGVGVEIEVIRTTGDRILDVPLARIGDRGLFTKEIDEALLEGRADLAVHSLKDVPTRLPEGLTIAAVSTREDPRDVLIPSPSGARSLRGLPAGARVGTSSLRRRSQLRRVRPDVEVVDLRGNLNTRLAKLDSGEYDAIILAAAGVIRLGWSSRIGEWLDPANWLPAVGQGALAVVARVDDAETISRLHPLHDSGTSECVAAERSFLRELEGGCQVPIGALATTVGDTIEIEGFVAGLDGERYLRHAHSGPRTAAVDIGRELAARLLADGAAGILQEVRRRHEAPGVPAP